MAKPEKKAEKKPAKELEDFKYGVDDVAEGLGIKPASARVQLRNNNIKKAGKSYGWNSKAEVEEVIKKLGGAKTKAEPKKPAAKKTEKAEPKKPAATEKKVKKEAA